MAKRKHTTYFLETFGCQMNVLDSQLVAGQLRALGWQAVGTPADADMILFNTCSVRQHAEDKVLSRLGELRRWRKQHPEGILGVLGCMAEREQHALFDKAPHLDLLCGPGELHRLPELIAEVAAKRKPVAALAESQSRRRRVAERARDDDPLETLDLSREPQAGADALQAYIRVQRGCDKFCTYCVVPYVRGPERSRPPENIVAEARRLVEQGCREITLLGQTVNSYAHEEVGLAELLRRVHAIDGLDRLRFVTSYPADWDEDIFRAMRDLPKVCPYLHIPAQSGSDRVLAAMKRRYTASGYLRLMDLARKYVPDIALAGDFIVGFCGETEGDFQATVDLVRRAEYKSIFVFKYSTRPGTTAERAKADDVPQDVKVRRNNELLAVQSEISRRHKDRLVGQTVEVLVEGYSKAARRVQQQEEGAAADTVANPDSGIQASERQLVGRTPHDLIAVFDGDAAHIGALAAVRVTAVSSLTLFGELERVVSPARLPLA
jgi:tRNA-2-methylthio-N6-dimethylallyladenosine synthase